MSNRLQKLYNVTFAIGGVSLLILVFIIAASTFGAVEPDRFSLLVGLGVVSVCLVVIHVFIYALNKRGDLSYPPYMKHGLMRAAAVIVFSIIPLIMLYGLYNWPAAPLTHRGDKITDKRGTEHSEQDYRRFLAWESNMLCAWGVVAICVVISIPVGRRKNVSGRRGGAA